MGSLIVAWSPAARLATQEDEIDSGGPAASGGRATEHNPWKNAHALLPIATDKSTTAAPGETD